GYGMVWGAAYGALFGNQQRGSLWRGAAYGLAQWAIGFFGFVPALQVHRPAHKVSLVENAINVKAHVVYGVVTALLVEELGQQTARGPEPWAERLGTRVG
ncbi:MAG: hypothetical protein QOF51_3958, partial [Chloroflexota bacterium]|nr:hypothetical protein [Chloroflexota bacterium]